MKIHAIDTGLFKLDGGAMHGVIPKSMWQKVNPADENNMCTWAMRCLLIVHDKQIVLIDTGMGTKQDERFFSFYYPHGESSLKGSLLKLGITPDQVTDVVLTHLHFDHCGGAVDRIDNQLVPAFPNARYYTHRRQWLSAIEPNIREKASFLKENMLPLESSGQLTLLDAADGDFLFDFMRLRIVQGHTESMMLPQIQYKDKTLLYCADLIPSMAHISLPWVMGYDMHPLITLTEKEILLKEMLDKKAYLIFEHDPKIACCTLQLTERGIRHHEIFEMDDL